MVEFRWNLNRSIAVREVLVLWDEPRVFERGFKTIHQAIIYSIFSAQIEILLFIEVRRGECTSVLFDEETVGQKYRIGQVRKTHRSERQSVNNWVLSVLIRYDFDLTSDDAQSLQSVFLPTGDKWSSSKERLEIKGQPFGWEELFHVG